MHEVIQREYGDNAKHWRASDIVAILTSLSPDPQRVAWRFKQWQRNGQMPGTGTGRGTKYEYSTEEVWRAALLNEFQMLGVIPSAAAALLDAHPGPDYCPNSDSRSFIFLDVGRIKDAIEARRAQNVMEKGL